MCVLSYLCLRSLTWKLYPRKKKKRRILAQRFVGYYFGLVQYNSWDTDNSQNHIRKILKELIPLPIPSEVSFLWQSHSIAFESSFARESEALLDVKGKTTVSFYKAASFTEVDGRSVNVRSLKRTERTVEQFKNESGIRCAWMNKTATLILNSNQMCEFFTFSKAFVVHSCKYLHWCLFYIVFIQITIKVSLECSVHGANIFIPQALVSL